MIRRPRRNECRRRTNRFETIDAFDRELVKFVVNWAPYGRPPEDEVLPRFGVSSDHLDQRVCDIAAAGLARNLCIDDRALLLRALALLDAAGTAAIPQPRRHQAGVRPRRRGAAEQDGARPYDACETSWSTL